MTATATRTPPKVVAFKRYEKLEKLAIATLDKLAPFVGDEARTQCTQALASMGGEIAELPDDFKPKRSRTGGRKSLEVGKAYEIKPKHAHRYAAFADGDASVCLMDKLIDDASVRVVFANGTAAVVKRAHLGNEMSLE